MASPVVLHSFNALLPQFQESQESIIGWLAEAHVQARCGARALPIEERLSLMDSLRKMITRFGGGPARIRNRSFVLSDFTHTDWAQARIFDLTRDPAGQGTRERMIAYSEIVNEVFEKFYGEDAIPPEKMIHVSCTGYASPSGAQRLVSRRNWGVRTEVTHAYHMGCYAAFPAVRIAQGFLATSRNPKARIDLVHTEICSLHLDPSLHSPEQLVVQSLFSDGFIRYEAQSLSVWEEASKRSLPGRARVALEVLNLREEILPATEQMMTWTLADHGFLMTLDREVPEWIAQGVKPYLENLFEEAGFSFAQEKESACFAIHPGGPKIIDRVSDTLGLSAAQTRASHWILREHGNMSSATLPHIWKSILEHESVVNGSLVAALAFGPGLTISGGLFRMRIIYG